jgi:CRISPR/Cas system CSM-associated protein Csm3 (group 7 of RAMP superfamily)
MVIRFNLRLRAVSLFTIGQGVPDVLGADVVFSKKMKITAYVDGEAQTQYVVYVPGSSFKGAWRTATSRIAESYGFKSCGEIDPERITRAHRNLGRTCDVCILFGQPGSPFDASKVWVGDFEPVGETPTDIIVRVSLNDKTQTARKGALYSMEHVLPGAEFLGEVRVLDEAKNLLPLLMLGLAELRTGVLGRRSLVDIRLEDNGLLNGLVGSEWLPLLEGLRKWLWEGVVET